MKNLKTILLITTVSLITSCKFQDKESISDNQIKRYEKQILLFQKEYSIPGLAVGISLNDSLIYSKGFGFSDIENQIKVTPNTPFRIASITKPFTVAVLMKLVEDGKINLDWKIKDYYPDYLGSCERILGYFNTDMPEYSFLLNQYQPNRDDITLKHHLSHTAEKVPGESYKYNGFLFGMLSDVIETVTLSKFDILVDNLIIKKLNLKNSLSSQLDTSKPNVIKSLAKPYIIKSNGTFEIGEYPDLELNAGAGIISTVTDLMKFDNAINQNLLVKESTKKEQFQPLILNNGDISPYGLGWFTQKYKGYTLIWHNGWQPNSYSGLYLKVLEKNLTLVLLANSEGLSAPFELGKGDVLSSDFAKSFLELVINE
ncbi:serine hydrolase domain-containing protein [Aquimarina aquimarini]|uniref:serine hydrolase domain-containing protein n=1 Tax=Aquimarina aquimarini TaxID=1191734 RepID=UPI000D561502|nr:serine hydrolase domain-containing protein [Aquimarina aquimarini]